MNTDPKHRITCTPQYSSALNTSYKTFSCNVLNYLTCNARDIKIGIPRMVWQQHSVVCMFIVCSETERDQWHCSQPIEKQNRQCSKCSY